jgi:hypothetical protein
MIEVSLRTYDYSTRKPSGRIRFSLPEGETFLIDEWQYTILNKEGDHINVRITHLPTDESTIRKMSSSQLARLYYHQVLKGHWKKDITL